MNNLHGWQWQTVEGNSYLTCDLLSAWQHGFFTKVFYPSTPEDLTSILQPKTSAYRVKQVHGNIVLTSQEITTAIAKQNLDNPFPDGDGVISHISEQSVWVASADCTPILIGDRKTGGVCAIHAGWRGTSQEIVKSAIARLVEFGSERENLRIAIGPAISGKMYQVNENVAIEVGKTIISDAIDKTEGEILHELKQLPNSPLFDDELPGKVRLDVSRVNQIQLEQLNINPEHIAIARNYCTYQHDDFFFSYRRTGEKKVQWSGIITNN
ncbi:peptidoglycan editing factor PgeF [Waterburya agarophytonicola K14]|uniref:Purine nucleoside phosphorylase n=1 Tax=Waterburya agarophytonicola KI4 TaxID=2874699 RepID=A0A964BQJ1_9CYAN|nr:peptidoglycan editing factor PgeF [Waterburya agarophytonicola]MCC0176296.1 peptidoglycan editing factor PgeF [Waterburya agarophytonicola KI4]